MPLLWTVTGKNTLRSLGREGLLLACDFDGTLVPHAPPAGTLSMTAETVFLLESLKQVIPMAIITGRSSTDVLRYVDPKLCIIAGNYGIEAPWVEQSVRDTAAASVRMIADGLRSLATANTLRIEDKTYSLTIHERDERVIRSLIHELQQQMSTGAFPVCRLLRGIGTLNLVPREAPTKGDALQACMKSLGSQRALFIGDDLPDEDAFKVPGTLGIRVGYSRSSAATYHVRHQGEVDKILRILCESFEVPTV